MNQEPLTITVTTGGFARSIAVHAVKSSGLPGLLAGRAGGPFGLTSGGVSLLEALVDATDLGLAAAHGLRGLILAEDEPAGAQPGAPSFRVARLTPEQQQLVSAFQAVVLADAARHGLAPLGPQPRVEGALDPEGLPELLLEGDGGGLAGRLLGLARRYLERHLPALPPGASVREATAALASPLAAFFELLRRGILRVAQGGSLRPLVQVLATRTVLVAGHPYRGLQPAPRTEAPTGLLPVTPEDVVGNEEYLQAGLRLARDVAAYDFDRRCNPKRLNPILFGLGRPGCGKTLTAHAIGNDFLRHCREREIPARFLVVQRTDWASSYQNASALNLVRLFREEVHGFAGVCGVYWPDLDTAFASRSATDLRQEEKQNLGALFGLFDGTLLPRDGRWFLICDANTLNMDEATCSRITQHPFTVTGPTTVDHFVRLMREIQLRDLQAFLPAEAEAWRRIGQAAVELALSGRAAEAICNQVRGRIQDFSYPDEYFRASAEQRRELLTRLQRPVTEGEFLELVRTWAAFRREAEAREAAARFDQEVQELVRQLNVSRAAAERLGEPTGPREVTRS